MWTSKIVDYSQINNTDLWCLISGKNPMIIVRGFYNKKECQIAVDNIKNAIIVRFKMEN